MKYNELIINPLKQQKEKVSQSIPTWCLNPFDDV